MDKCVMLTQDDKTLLRQISRAVRGESNRDPNRDGREGFTAMLAAAVPKADPAFKRQLEARLVNSIQSRQGAGAREETVTQRIGTAARHWFAIRWRRVWTVAAALIAVMGLALLVLGPAQVWANVQRWLGYVPGVGFVHLEETRALGAPVVVTREGVTVIVRRVLAQPHRTLILLSGEGLPPEDQIWPTGPETDAIVEPVLELPDGQVLTTTTFNLNWGAGTLEFPPLPDDVHHITLVLPRLPLVPQGVAPEEWRIPLNLRSDTGAEVAAHFPQPYAPVGAEDTHRGVTLRLLGVAHSPEETALHLQVQWSNPEWQGNRLMTYGRSWTLHDDLGHVYYRTSGAHGANSGSLSQSTVVKVQTAPDATPTPTPSLPTYEEVVTFAPVSPAARSLTHTLSGLAFDVPAEGRFSLDLGQDPQIGDTWPLDIDLQVAGFPVHLSRARWEEHSVGRPEEGQRQIELRLDFAPVPEQAGVTLCGIRLTTDAAGFRSGSGGGYNVSSNRMRATLVLQEGAPLPTGKIDLGIDSVQLCLNDTWSVAWEIPGTGQADAARVMPVQYSPEGAEQTHHDLTLQVEEVVLSDRLTWMQVGLTEAPEGISLLTSYTPWGPGAYPPGIILRDDRGRRYEHPEDVAWYAGDSSLTRTVFAFEPLQPLARRLALEIPTVRVVQAAPAAFDVTVPEGVRVTLDASDAPWGASQPWAVDIPLEVAGYRVHFTEARLEELNGTTLLMLSSAPYRVQDDKRTLFGLEMGTVHAPDGRDVDLETAHSSAGPQKEKGALHQVRLAFDVVDPNTGLIQAGRYNVEIDGAWVRVEGPWKLSWKLP
ncbi:MAG: hypothetical protein ACP5JG_12710 [Anaerolineae bacterium]